MENLRLGKLKEIELRKKWKLEKEFTNWLVEKENLLLLSEEVGIDIKLIKTEADVGDFSVDILAEEENTGKKIIIENFLEKTDHDHLGKIITYASGHDAEYIILITKEIKEEHRQAIDWLNNHTDENINFFAIKIELWQIGDSSIAPKFDIISKPNDWFKTLKKAVGSGELSELALKELEFSNRFRDYCRENNIGFTIYSPQPGAPAYFTITSLVSPNSWVAMKMNNREKKLTIDARIGDLELFNNIKNKYSEELKKEFGKEFSWTPHNIGGNAGKYIDFDINNMREWENYFSWAKEFSEKLYKYFSKYIKELNK